MDEYFRSFNLVHNFSSSTLPITTMVHEDDNWVKEFFLLVLSEEQEASTLIHGDVMKEPSPSQ